MAKSRNSSEQPPDPPKNYPNWAAFTWGLLIIANTLCHLHPSTLALHRMFFIPSHSHILRGAHRGRNISETLLESTLPITTAHLHTLPSPALTKLPKHISWHVQSHVLRLFLVVQKLQGYILLLPHFTSCRQSIQFLWAGQLLGTWDKCTNASLSCKTGSRTG